MNSEFVKTLANPEFVNALIAVVAQARSTMQEPVEFVVTSPNGYSIGMTQALDGTISKSFETGPAGEVVFPLEFHVFDANGKKKTIIIADECEACEVTQ